MAMGPEPESLPERRLLLPPTATAEENPRHLLAHHQQHGQPGGLVGGQARGRAWWVGRPGAGPGAHAGVARAVFIMDRA